jgi:hypothetical protein
LARRCGCWRAGAGCATAFGAPAACARGPDGLMRAPMGLGGPCPLVALAGGPPLSPPDGCHRHPSSAGLLIGCALRLLFSVRLCSAADGAARAWPSGGPAVDPGPGALLLGLGSRSLRLCACGARLALPLVGLPRRPCRRPYSCGARVAISLLCPCAVPMLLLPKVGLSTPCRCYSAAPVRVHRPCAFASSSIFA